MYDQAMWNALKVLIWTLGAVSLGIFLATHEVEGRTPYEHAQRAWKRHVSSSSLGAVKDSVGRALEDVKDEVTSTEEAPRERHSADDKAAVQRLIAKGASR